MKCISSPALDDAEIMSYVEGEASDAVITHIKECPYCRERAEQFTGLQSRLRKELYRVMCPSPQELGEYQLGLLSAPQVLVIAQHVRDCPLCRRELAELDEFLADEPSEAGFLGSMRVLIARLLNNAEGLSAPPAVALRGEVKAPLTFEADGLVITLEVDPGQNGQISLLGQLAAEDQDQWTGAEVRLKQADSTQLTTSMDDLGAFRFEGVPAGAIRIIIRSLYGTTVQIPMIDAVP